MGGASLALTIVVGLGLLGAIGKAIKAVLDRRGLTARAVSDEATATSVLTAAARELVDPTLWRMVEAFNERFAIAS